MKRFAVYKGVPGKLVAHPINGHTSGATDGGPQRTGRQVGLRMLTGDELRAMFHGELPTLAQLELPHRYEVLEEVVEVTTHSVRNTLNKACAKNELVLVRGPIDARDLAEASARLQPERHRPETAEEKAKRGDLALEEMVSSLERSLVEESDRAELAARNKEAAVLALANAKAKRPGTTKKKGSD